MPLMRNDLQASLWQLQPMPRLQNMSVFQLRPVTPMYAALICNPPKLRCMSKINGNSNQTVLNTNTDGQVHNKYRYTRKAMNSTTEKLCNVFRVQNGNESVMEKAHQKQNGNENFGFKEIAENRTSVASLGFDNSSKSRTFQEQNLIDQNGNIITDILADSKNVQTQKWIFGNLGCESDVLSSGNINKCASNSTSGGQYTCSFDINANRTAVSNTGSIQEWDHAGAKKKCPSEGNGTMNHRKRGILNVDRCQMYGLAIGSSCTGSSHHEDRNLRMEESSFDKNSPRGQIKTSSKDGSHGNTSNQDTEKMSSCINNRETTTPLATQEDSRHSYIMEADEDMLSEDKTVHRDHVLLGSVQGEGLCRCKDRIDFLMTSKGRHPLGCLSCKGSTPCKCEKKNLSKLLNPDTNDQRNHQHRNNQSYLCKSCGLLMINDVLVGLDEEVKLLDYVEGYSRKSVINMHHTFDEIPICSRPLQENVPTFSKSSRLHAEPIGSETQILNTHSISLKPLTGSVQYTNSTLDDGKSASSKRQGLDQYPNSVLPDGISKSKKLPTPGGKTNFFVLKSPEVKSTNYKLPTADGKTVPYRLLRPDEKGTSYVLKLSNGKSTSYRLLLPDKKGTSFELLPPARKITPSCQLARPGEKCTTFVLKLSDEKPAYSQLLTPDDKGTNFVLKLSDGKSITYNLLKPDVGDEKGTSFVLLSLDESCTSYKLPSVHRKCTSSNKGKPASPKPQMCTGKINSLNQRRVDSQHTDSKTQGIDDEKSTSPEAQRPEESPFSPTQLKLNTERERSEHNLKAEFFKMHHLYRRAFPEENLEETRFFQASDRKGNTNRGDGTEAKSGQSGYRNCAQIPVHFNKNLERPLAELLSSLTEEKKCAGDSLSNEARFSPSRHSVHGEQDKYALLSPDSEESNTEGLLCKTQRCDRICTRNGLCSAKHAGKGICAGQRSRINMKRDLYSATQPNRRKGTVRKCGRIGKKKGLHLPPELDVHLSRKQRNRATVRHFRSFTTNQKQEQPVSDNLAKLRKRVTKTSTKGDGSFLSGSNELQKKNGRSSLCSSTQTDGGHSGRSVLGFSSRTPNMLGLCKFMRLGGDTLCDVSHSVLDRNISNKILEIVPKSNNHCHLQREKQFSQRRLAASISDSGTSMVMKSRESAPKPHKTVQEVKGFDPGLSIFVEPRWSDPGQKKATELRSDPTPIKDGDSRGCCIGPSMVRELKGSDLGQCKAGELKIVQEVKGFVPESSVIGESRGSDPGSSIVAEPRGSDPGSVIVTEPRGSNPGPSILREPPGSGIGPSLLGEPRSSDPGKSINREMRFSDSGPSIVREPQGSDSGPSIVREPQGSDSGTGIILDSRGSDTGPSLIREIRESDAGSDMARESKGSDTIPHICTVTGGSESGPSIVGESKGSDPDQDLYNGGYMEETMPLSRQAKSLLDQGIEDSINFQTLYPYIYSALTDQGQKNTHQSCTLEDSLNLHTEHSCTSQDQHEVNDRWYLNCNTDTAVMNKMYTPMDASTKSQHSSHCESSVNDKLSASNDRRTYSFDFFSSIILHDKRVLKAQAQKLRKTISYLDDAFLRKYRQDLLDVRSLHTCRGLYHYKRAPRSSYIGQKIIHPKLGIIRILKKKLLPALIRKLKERIETRSREHIKQRNQVLGTFSSLYGNGQQAKETFGLVNMVQRRIKAQKKQKKSYQKCTIFIPQNTASQVFETFGKVKTSYMDLTEKVTECHSTEMLDKLSDELLTEEVQHCVESEVKQQLSAAKRLEVKEHVTGAERSEVKGQESFIGESEFKEEETVIHSEAGAVDGLERTQKERLLMTKGDEGDVEFSAEMTTDDQHNNICSVLFHDKLPDSSIQEASSVVSTTNDEDYQMITLAEQMMRDLQDKSDELSIKECHQCFCHMSVEVAQDVATTDGPCNEERLSILNPSLQPTQSSNNLSTVVTSGVLDNLSSSGASYSQICKEEIKCSNDIHSASKSGIQENEISSYWDRNCMFVCNKSSTTYWGCGPHAGQIDMVCTPHTSSDVVNYRNMIRKQEIGSAADTRKPDSSFMQQMLELVDNVMCKNTDGSKTSAICDQDTTVSSSCETVDNILNVAQDVTPSSVDEAPADHVLLYSDISEDDIGLRGIGEDSSSDPEDLEYMEDLQYGQQ